jgi:predicted transcriptional regulator
MNALLSIKPEYAERIFDGSKKFEYRRLIFKQPVQRVIVYASSPIRKVIGEFEIDCILHDSIAALWNSTKEMSGVGKKFFESYFAGKETGYAIQIKNATRYTRPQCLMKSFGVSPPQSFTYV